MLSIGVEELCNRVGEEEQDGRDTNQVGQHGYEGKAGQGKADVDCTSELGRVFKGGHISTCSFYYLVYRHGCS